MYFLKAFSLLWYCHFSICVDACLSLLSFALLLLVFLVRGWLMWVYPTIQAINVSLSMHLYPSTLKWFFCPSYLSIGVSTYTCIYSTPCLLSYRKVKYYGLRWHSRKVCVMILSYLCKHVMWLLLLKGKLEEKGFSGTLSERNFDFMVLIIFLRNHSRMKHKRRRDCSPFRCTTMGLLG